MRLFLGVSKKLQRLSLLLGFLIIGFALLTVSCSNPQDGSGSGSGGSPINSKPTPDIDPWSAPVGALLEGVTLSDGWTDLRELPAPINVSGGWTDSVAISNNGHSLYFSYMRYDFAQIMEGGGLVVTGPAREGMTGNHFKNFRADLGANGWTVNYLPVNLFHNTLESSLSANASEDLWVWSVWSADASDSDIYYSTKNADGSWNTPIKAPVPVNSACSDDNPFVVGEVSSNITILIESNRLDDMGTTCGTKRHIYSSVFNPYTGIFTTPTKIPNINGTNPTDEDHQPFVTKDRSKIFWTALRSNFYGVMTADLIGGVYTNIRPVAQPTTSGPFVGKVVLLGEANVTQLPQGWLMYMMCGVARSETGAVHNAELKVCVARKPNAQPTHMKINTGTGWSDSPFISRDGKRLYFMYSRYSFAPWITSGGAQPPVLLGPDRAGLNKSASPWDESDIYMSTKNLDGTWSEPVNLGLNGAYGDSSGMEINNGNTFVWLQGNGAGNNIVMANKNPDGTWGAPIDFGVGVNSHASGVIQDNPHISADGKSLWFVSNRANGVGSKDIWFSSFTGGSWSNPVNFSAINTTGDEDQPWVSPVSNDMYWNSSSGLMHCLLNGSTCSAAPTLVTIPGCGYVAEASLPDDGQSIYFGCGDAVTGTVKIMYSTKQSNGSWGAATPVD